MHFVKYFNINGVDTRQVACVEINGKPNSATEGFVGALCMDMSSPLHDVYKCVAVNGSIYTWELLSSGLSIMSATITGLGAGTMDFPYANLTTPTLYVVKIGDLILDNEGYLYQVNAINTSYCSATYLGVNLKATTHRHPANDIVDGTFGGQVVANSNGQSPSTMLLRNSKLLPSTTISTYPTVSGEICWEYK